jgi:ceramide glucosyltransferase
MTLSLLFSWIVRIASWACLVPVLGGSVYALLCLLAVARFRAYKMAEGLGPFEAGWPPVTVLKPVHGIEKNQRENLRSTCLQDYPDFQVVFSVQELDDPAIPILYEIQREFGCERVTVAIENRRSGTNGKINNMVGGLLHARHHILVISDSDVKLRPDYLKAIVAPLADPEVGCVCTLYKAACARTWYEKTELLTLNADFMTSVVFAHVSGASKFCLGASAALRRSTLDDIGGLEALADYLVEDYEMGRRIWKSGKKIAVVPYIVDTMVDLKSPSQWWSHQVYWDQNTRSARPAAFFYTVTIRSIPFALLYAVLQGLTLSSLEICGAAILLRLATAGLILRCGFGDREGLNSLWLLPFRDVASLVSWLLAFTKRTTVWRGTQFVLTRDGRLLAREAKP